jgi:hypothetical protein
MYVYIPSRSRYGIKSLTLERIRGGWPEAQVRLVVPAKQVKLYKDMPERGGIGILGLPGRRHIAHQTLDRAKQRNRKVHHAR